MRGLVGAVLDLQKDCGLVKVIFLFCFVLLLVLICLFVCLFYLFLFSFIFVSFVSCLLLGVFVSV